jgi:hypothetical protein
MKVFRRGMIALIIALCAPLLAAEPADAPQHQPFEFAVFGDAQPYGREFSPVLSAIATEVGQLGVPFVMGAGDYIDGSTNQATVRRQWEGFFTAIAPLQAWRETPVALAPGNHDIVGVRRNAQIFCEYFNKLYFSFDYQGCHFVILNTETVGADARISGTQLKWLKQDLESARDSKFTFVAMHRPLFPVDGNIGYSLDKHPKQRDALHALFVESGVDVVFCGHEHLYNYQKRDGIHYFITGGGGAKLYAEPQNGGFHHYLLVSVEDRNFTVEVKRVTP